jgi:hypothetical protein
MDPIVGWIGCTIAAIGFGTNFLIIKVNTPRLGSAAPSSSTTHCASGRRLFHTCATTPLHGCVDVWLLSFPELTSCLPRRTLTGSEVQPKRWHVLPAQHGASPSPAAECRTHCACMHGLMHLPCTCALAVTQLARSCSLSSITSPLHNDGSAYRSHRWQAPWQCRWQPWSNSDEPMCYHLCCTCIMSPRARTPPAVSRLATYTTALHHAMHTA